MRMSLTDLSRSHELRDPSWYRMLFANTMMAPLWLIVRTYVGWQWINAGWEKLHGGNWITNNGVALEGFWKRIVAVPATGSAPIHYDWYRNFIQFMLDHGWYHWFAWIISFGEFFVGLGLIVGLLTGFAALGGITMNFNFMLAGSASTNPVLFLLGILILLAWKVAGRIGMDRWVLPFLGTPWEPGIVTGTAPPSSAAGGLPAGG